MPLWCLYGINRSATGMIAVAARKTVKTADLRGGTAETLNMFKTFAVPPRVGPIRSGIAAAPPLPPWHRTRTAVAPPSPPCLRRTTAVQSRKGRLVTLRRSYGGSTLVMVRRVGEN